MENKELTNQQATNETTEKKGFWTKVKGIAKSKPAKIAAAVVGGGLLAGAGYLIGKKRSNSEDECYYEDEVDSVEIYDDTEE